MMGIYQVKVIDKDGNIREFSKEYGDIGRMQEDLRQNGQLLVEYKEKRKKRGGVRELIHRLPVQLQSRRVSDEDIYNLFYQLGIILKADVPLVQALRMMIDETNKTVLKVLIQDILFRLKEGGNFSDILESKSKLYPFTPYIPIIRSGEKTGMLGESFLTIAGSIDKRMQLRNEITNAMIYPLILVGTGLMAVYVMLVYVIPRFEPIVKSFKVVLPFHTRVLFRLSLFLNNNQDILIVGMIVLLLLLLLMGREQRFRVYINEIFNRMPVVRGIKFTSETLQFLNTLSNLLRGGVPILVAMELGSQSFTSRQVRKQMGQVAISLRKGESLAASLKETGIFPGIIPDMIRVGEESGRLVEVLEQLYHFLSQKFLKRTRKYMNLLEPLVIIFIALFVGLLIMSIIPILMNISDVKF